MTSPVTNTTGGSWASFAGTAAASTTSGTAATAAGTGLGKDTFLKLLVAQLKYQDPNSPADTNQIMSQTAQYAMVESLNSIQSDQEELMGSQILFGAAGLVGSNVTYLTSDGTTTAQGKVTSVSFAGSTPTLRIDGTDVPMTSITKVGTDST